MKRIFPFFLALMFFVISYGTAFSQSTGTSQRTGTATSVKRISDIKIEGNKSVSTATILSRLKIKPGDIYDGSAVNNELRRLYATGYFMDISVSTEDRPEGVLVIFKVVEKPLITAVEFEGNKKAKKATLLKKISIKKGDLLDRSIVAQDISQIKSYYVDQGYSDVDVSYKTENDPSGGVKLIFVIKEGITVKIKSIKFEGNKSIKTGELTKFMSTKTAWWFIRKGAYDEEKFQEDLNRITSYYRSKGFLDVQATSKFSYSDDGRFMYITIIISEGKQYRIGAIKVNGQLALPEKNILKLIKIKTGDPFDYESITNMLDSIRGLYYDKGYMNAEVNLQHEYNSMTGNMDLTIIINAHDVVYVGSVNIIGNTRTKDKVIRREIRVYPGERYDGIKLKKSKERLYNLGFFEDVYFDTVDTGQKDVKDLNVTVKEAKTGELSFGGGYSSIDAFIGFAQIRQKNFDATNFPTFVGGGQDLTIRAEVGSARNDYLLSWMDPWIFDYPFSFGFDLYRNEYDRYGDSGYDYDERRTGGSLKLGKEITDELTTGLIYNLEKVEISNIPDTASQDLKDESGNNYISRLTWDTRYDTRDNKFSPTEGMVANLSLENAGGILAGDKDFLKGVFNTSFYFTIIPSVVLELKGRAGMTEPYDNTDKVPIYERFFVGGARTIRGYNERSVGPRDASDKDLVIGGDSMIIGNAEVTFPIYKRILKGAVFFDIGGAMKKSSDIFETDQYKSGTGVGLRIKTPIGPVQLDYGFPLNSNEGDKKNGHFYFSMSHGF